MHPLNMRARSAHWQAVAVGLGVAVLSGAAWSHTSGAILHVAVLPERYVAADVALPDLEVLGELVGRVDPSLLQLEACGDEAAAALLAAAERFRERRLELHLQAGDDPVCKAAGQARAIDPGQVRRDDPKRRPDAAGERYWQTVMP
jgi:hypothetical protein